MLGDSRIFKLPIFSIHQWFWLFFLSLQKQLRRFILVSRQNKGVQNTVLAILDGRDLSFHFGNQNIFDTFVYNTARKYFTLWLDTGFHKPNYNFTNENFARKEH